MVSKCDERAEHIANTLQEGGHHVPHFEKEKVDFSVVVPSFDL